MFERNFLGDFYFLGCFRVILGFGLLFCLYGGLKKQMCFFWSGLVEATFFVFRMSLP